MLPEKPWRGEAVARLFASVIICAVFLGAVAISALDWFTQAPGARSPRVLIGLAGAGVGFAGVVICAVLLGAVALSALDWFTQAPGARSPRVLIGLAGAGVCFAAVVILLGRNWSL